MMPAPPPASTSTTAMEGVVMTPAAAVPEADHEQHPSSRRTSRDGTGTDPAAGSEDYSDDSDLGAYHSSDSDEEPSEGSSSDEESLAARAARSNKRHSSSSPDQGPSKKPRRSSDSGAGSDGGGSGRKRRNLFPAVRRSQRCGNCHTCLNPQLKKACITMRERMMKEMQGGPSSSSSKRSSSKAAAAASLHHQPSQQQQLASAGSGDLDQDKYVDMLEPLIDRSGALIGANEVGPFIQVMPSFRTTLSRILPTSVLALSKPSLLSDFMAAGGVDMLASWMLEAEGEDSDGAKTLLVDVLQLLQKLPVTKAFVSSTRSAKVIGSLRKHRDPDIQQLAHQVVKLWMKVIPSKGSSSSGGASSAKASGSASKPAGASASAAAAAGSAAAAKKTSAQVAASVNGAAGRQLISDNDLFRPAAAAAAGGKPKTSLRVGMGQPKRTGGVQLVDTAEAGKLLTGSTAAAAAPGRPAAGSKLLASQRPRLPSPPPLGSTAGAAPSSAAAAAASPRVAVELQVTPEQTVAVTLRVIQPPAGRLPGLRQRAGFGSSLGGRQLGGAAAAAGAPGAVQAAVTGAAWGAAAAAAAGAEAAAAAAAEKKPRKPKKRVSWKSERELESVRWFVKEDPAIKAREDAHLTDEQLRALAAQRHPHSDFHNLIMMEHQHEKTALEAHHREEQEQRRAAVAAMQPGCPWHGTPPALQLQEDWQVALGEDSAEARLVQRPLHEVLHLLAYAERVEPAEGPELLQPRPSNFNIAHHDPNVRLIPLVNAKQQQQQQPQVILQQMPVTYTPAQQAPVTYTLGQGLTSQGPQLVVQQIQQPLQPQQQQFLPQAQPPAVSAAAGGPPSSSDNSQLMQVLASLSQSGLSSLLQQQQPAVSQQVSTQQQQQQQQQPQQQMLQPPPPAAAAPGLAPPAGIPAGHQLVSLNGMQVLIPPGTAIPAGAILMGAPAGAVQLPPGFQLPPLAPGQQQQQPAVTIYGGQQQQPGPPGPMHNRPEDDHYHDYGPPGGGWGGGPPPPGPYGRGPPEGGPGGPMRHGRGGGGMGRGGGPYERGGPGGPARSGPAPWTHGRLCKFFSTNRGCSKGDVCDFKHVVPGSDLDVREQGP